MEKHLCMIGAGAEERRSPINFSAGPPAEDRRSLEVNVERSMAAMLNLLLPSLTETDHDEAMIALGASSARFVEPLNQHEVQLLACALYLSRRNRPLTYYDVLVLTDKFSGKAMNVTMIYKTLERLTARNLLMETDAIDGKGRRSRSFWICERGREVFRLAVLNSRLLAEARSPAAA